MIVGAQKLYDAMELSRTRRIALGGLGDSNQARETGGWDHGTAAALLARFGATSMYAHYLGSFWENGGQGINLGYGMSSNAISYRSGWGGGYKVSEDLIVNHDNWWTTGPVIQGTRNPLAPIYGPEGSEVDAADRVAVIAGFRLSTGNPLGKAENPGEILRYDIWLGKFPGATSQARWRWVWTGGSSNASVVSMASSGENYEVVKESFVCPVGEHDGILEIRKQEESASSADSYPFCAFMQQVVRADRTTGWSYSTLFAIGSSTIEDTITYLDNVTGQGTGRIGNYFTMLCSTQVELGLDPVYICFINFGANASPSVESYEESLTALRSLLMSGWVTAGFNLANLHFVLMPSHPMSSDDSEIAPYRAVCRELAETWGETYFDLSDVTNNTELVASGLPRYDNSGADTAHLDQSDPDSSYTILMSRLFDAMDNLVEAGSEPATPAGGSPYWTFKLTE